MRLRRALAALGVAFAWAFAAQAYDYNGVTVTAESGSIQKIGDELLVTFNQVGTGKLTLDGYALARVMVVGGGGSGSTGRKATSGTGLDYRGNGGSGGEAIEYDNHYLAAGAYEVAVGAGGAAIEAANNGARTAGNSGGQSSFAGIVAKGGAGGVVETGSQNGTGSNTVMGWGSNLKTDISGETLTYSTGGAAAASETKAGSKGADGGCGGGGGGRTNYKSGAGGKGIVIVRIKAASVNPPATASFDQFVQYVEGVAVSPFDSIPPWAATITGTTNSTQRGHFSFTVSLKDGYVWSDTFGREDRTFKWAVVDDPAKGDTYLDVTKTVRADPSNPSNATISIIGHVPSEKVAVNVLFMGTMCYAHSLQPTTIQAAINSIAKRATVDWYLFHSKDVLKAKTGKLRDYATDVCSQIADTMIHTNLSGSVAKGGVIDDNFVRNELDRQMQSNNHQALNSFMELLYEVSQDPARSKRYDYIVLEFDGSRVADGYTTYEHEAEVAAFLKSYYDAKKVIWLVDNCAAGSLEPFGSMGTNGRKNKYYCPCTYFHNGNSHQLYEDFQYRGLIAFTDPDHYKSDGTRATLCTSSFKWKPPKDAKTYEQYREDHGEGKNTQTVYANDAYDVQIPYDDADGVSDYLSLAIKEKPYDLEFVDKIVDSGLEITAAHMSTSNVERVAADLNWLAVTDPSVVSIDINQAAHKVNAVVSNMCSEVWAKLDIDVRDTGSFRTGADPVYDEDLGRLVATKDPNDGNGFVFKYDPGDDEPTAQGDSSTLEPWKYNVYVVTGLVVNGTLKIDGIETNEAFKAEGYDCSVTYRGDPGYALDSITVDGTPLTADEINEHLSDYGFTNIKADHEVVVVYTNFVVTSEPYTNYYDGAEHTIDVQLPDYHDDITDVKVQYSTDGETYVDTKPVYSNVEHTVVYYKVVGHQAGYGDEEITLATGSDTVDILPREVNVTAKSARKFYDGEELTAGYEVQHDYADDLRENGWGFVGTDDITTVKMTGESVIGADAAKTEKKTAQNVIDQDQTKFTSDEIAGNYIVHYTDGELEVIPVAVKPVVKIYDGAPTNVEVVVTDEPAGTKVRYSYAEDGEYAEAGELTFTGPTNVWEGADREIWVEVSAPGYGAVTNRASATILPRIVVEQAGSDKKAYDGEKLVCSNATELAEAEIEKVVEVYEARGYTTKYPEIDPADAAGFVEGEGFVVAADGNTYLRMTDDSWRLDAGETNNVIKADRETIEAELNDRTSYGNYLFFYEDGLLEVTNAVLTLEAFPAEKFYDGVPTNISFTVKGPQGRDVPVDPATEVFLREKREGDGGWVPASEFVPYLNATNWNGAGVEVEVKVEKNGYSEVTASSTVLVKQRIVVEHAKNASKNYDGTPLRQPDYFEDEDEEAALSKNKWGTDEVLPDSIGFVDGEGFAADLVMTGDSRQTIVGEHPNVIDRTGEKAALKSNTNPDNYDIHYLDGSLVVVDADPYDGEYDAKGHSIAVNVPGIPGVDPGEVTVTYSWNPGGPYTSSEALAWTDAVTDKTVYYKVEIPGYPDVYGSSTIGITPVPVVIVSNGDSKTYDGDPLTNWTGVATITTNGVSETFDVETEVPLLGSDAIVLTYTGSRTEVGSSPNTFDYAFLDPARSVNYLVTTNYGVLAVIQRQEEVRRDPEIVIPEEAKEAVEESDKEIEKTLDEMAKADQEATDAPYVKYQLTVTPTNHLSETTRTTPEKAAEDAKEQVELAESETGSKIDKVEFVDIVLERTYSKEEAEATAAGDYNKDNWEPLDKAEEHGNKLLEVVIPVEIPDGMDLIGVTRSCDNKGTEILKPKDPDDPTAEGYVYDPETKTVTLYAYDFCVFGFMMKEKTPPPPPPVNPCGRKDPVNEGANVYQLQMQLRSTWGIPCSSAVTAELCGRSNPGVSSVIRIPASFVVNAWLYNCTNACWTLENSSIVAWEQNRAKFFSQPAITWDLLNIIGVSADQSETAFTFTGRIDDYSNGASATPLGADWSVTCAGQGTFSRSAGKYTFFSGYCAGDVSASYCIQGKICEASKVATCGSSLTTCPTGVAPSAVYGRWALRYNEQASLQYWRDGTFSIPANIRR